MAHTIYRKDQAALLCKAEATAGVDSVPEATDVIEVTNLSVKKEKTFVKIPLVKGYRGANPSIFVGQKATIEFECPLAHGATNGALTLGALPQIDVPLRACAMQRTQVLSYTIDTAQGGGRDGIILASGSSATDDYFAGRPVAVAMLSGSARAPSSAAKNIVKLAAATAEHSGTAGSGSTTTSVVLAATASTVDGDYVGQDMVVGAETRAITAYNGATQTATVTAFTSSTASTAYKILFADDGLVGYELSLTHYSGTIIDDAGHNSVSDIIYLPISVVSTVNLKGMFIEVTTGSDDPETVRITAYDTSTRKAKLQRKLTTTPTSSSTFVILEKRLISAYSASSMEVTLSKDLVRASVVSEAYTLNEFRLITGYNGTSKFATVDRPFTKRITGSTGYTIYPAVSYDALPNDNGEITATFYYFEEDKLYRAVNAKGTWVIDRNSAEYEKIKFTFTAVCGIDEDSTRPSVSSSRYYPALPVNNDNAFAMSIMGFATPVISKCSVDIGNKVVHRNDPGDEAVYIMDHDSSLKLTMDETSFAEFDVNQLADDGVVQPFWYANGTIGQLVVLYMGQTQFSTSPNGSDKDGILTQDLELSALPANTGGGDIKLIFT